MKNSLITKRYLDPFWGYGPFSSALKEFFDQSSPLNDGEVRESFANFSPKVHISDRGDSYFFSVDLPGLKKEDIHLEIKDGFMSIWGERNIEVKKDDYLEVNYGKFERRFKVSPDLDVEKVSAQYENGVLSVSCAKKGENISRKVNIN